MIYNELAKRTFDKIRSTPGISLDFCDEYEVKKPRFAWLVIL